MRFSLLTAYFPRVLRSKAAMTAMASGLRTELSMSGHNVSVSTLFLGLIGTDANNRGGLTSRAMPVHECAQEMVCAIDARAPLAYVPQTIGLFSTLINLIPSLGTPLSHAEYVGG